MHWAELRQENIWRQSNPNATAMRFRKAIAAV